MTLRVVPLRGAELEARLPDLARLRIEVFRAYPYLYDGDLAYEARYLRSFAAAPDAMIVAALDGQEVVGASTCAPLAAQSPEIIAPFVARALELARFFYFGESVLRAPYRGSGIGIAFFEHREAQAQACGARIATFCSVVRPDDHPMRPAGYVPLDAFWAKRGYHPVAGLTCRIAWKQSGAREETEQDMQFWQKVLGP